MAHNTQWGLNDFWHFILGLIKDSKDSKYSQGMHQRFKVQSGNASKYTFTKSTESKGSE